MKLSIRAQHISIKAALKQIQQGSQVKFFYGNDVDRYNGVYVNLTERENNVKLAIDRVLKPTDLRYTQKGLHIMIDAKPTTRDARSPDPGAVRKATPQRPGRISGKILDERGEPLVGASVLVIGNGNLTTQTDLDGSYTISCTPGRYTLEVRYLSFQTQRITDVVVKDNTQTPLTVSMKAEANTLGQVVVTSGYKKASVDGLYSEQKNRAAIGSGIAAEQIAATPDRHVGETLKRISGVNTTDNKFVLIRGIGERYNAALLDGTVLPSTEAQRRSFSFELVPNALVDNVVVVKTITPDMNTGFGGGAIQVNTKDIPTENFMDLTVGSAINDQSAGKKFLSRKRGKYDYLGFDDGRRAFPADLKTMSTSSPVEELIAQTKRFTQDNFTVHRYRAAPAQHYQFTLGRLYPLDDSGQRKFGFTGALSYRNNQTVNAIEAIRRGNWNTNTEIVAQGRSYDFNTTLGGVLNMGLQLGQHRLSLRNTYTHVYSNALTRIKGVSSANDFDGQPEWIREADDPTFTTLLQNKLSGQHQLGNMKVDWDVARTDIAREQKDIGIATRTIQLIGKDTIFAYFPNPISEARFTPISRQHYSNDEKHYSWNVSASRSFDAGILSNTIKTGYFGTHRRARFDWKILPLLKGYAPLDPALTYIPIGDMLKPENVRADGYLLLLDGWGNDYYAGESQNHAGYLMLDNRLANRWRLVWGLRAEYYDYQEIHNGSNSPKQGAYGAFDLPADKAWQWLPSANLTYSPLGSLNIRAAYSSTVVRPEMMDNSQFFRYSAFYDGLVGSAGISSTRIDSWDFKTEWFPGLGELLSIGGYYKYFDKPAEMIAMETLDFGFRYTLKNSNWAKVYGMELEARKNLGFIADVAVLQHLTLSGNLTYQQSKVEGLFMTNDNDPENGKPIMAPMRQKRALYGQAPYLLNAGLQYQDDKLGMNIVYNKSGRKTYFVTTSPANTEYEQPREQLDVQLSYRFFKSKLEVKINGGNLLDAASVFYNNRGSYEVNPDSEGGSLDFSNAQRLKPGFTDDYEDGDLYTFKQRFGRTFSTSLTYRF
ncbi:TonB-dependent receptor domain-containing protein [Sphingobacterium suaedae]|uniref:TonB-dependent receptor domain-containing protein n=1 Tax=Sphingobacterium suaedae TaxID=1686402 RepID=A0ABW5KPH8_9SPHI